MDHTSSAYNLKINTQLSAMFPWIAIWCVSGSQTLAYFFPRQPTQYHAVCAGDSTCRVKKFPTISFWFILLCAMESSTSFNILFLSHFKSATMTLLFLAFVQGSSQGTFFDVPVFHSNNADFVTVGGAHYAPDNLSVYTNKGVTGTSELSTVSSGRVTFRKQLVHMRDSESRKLTSFTTAFTFAITLGEGTTSDRSGWQTQTSGFGMTLSSGNISTFIYAEGDSTMSGLNSLVGVEIDTFRNYIVNDPSDNHVGINVHNTIESAFTYNLCGGKSTTCSFPWTGQFYTAWIEYNIASSLTFEVWLANGTVANGVAKPLKPLISVPKLDLFRAFEDYMYVGMDGGPGMHGDSHRILSWKFNSTFPEEGKPSKKESDLFYFRRLLKKNIIVMVFTTPCAAMIAVFLYRQKKQHEHLRSKGNPMVSGPYTFSYKELKKATNNFHESALLGGGGFGIVYKGNVQIHTRTTWVAVKKLKHVGSEQGKKSFLSEASSISQIRHRNLVQLFGCCYEAGHFLLVFDYMSNGSLDEWLFPKRRLNPNDPKYLQFNGILPWQLRRSILAGVSAALEYLHEDWVQCILHRDVKSSNVMLDDHMNPHLGDFGLARFMDHDKFERTTIVAGTLGYIAPEVLYTGKATKESDVYGFGILLLEVVCGRHPLHPEASSAEDTMLLHSVWRAHEGGNILSVVDPKLFEQNPSQLLMSLDNTLDKASSSNCNTALIDEDSSAGFQNQSTEFEEKKVMRHLLQLGLLCTLPDPKARPTMRVVNQLIMEVDDTFEGSSLALNHMLHLPLQKPMNSFPLPGFECEDTIYYSDKSSNRRHRSSHQDNTPSQSKSRLVAMSLGHEAP